MIKRVIYILFSLLLLIQSSAFSETTADSTRLKMIADSSAIKQKRTTQSPELKSAVAKDTIKVKSFKPNPAKSVWMGAVIPGYGQILNHKYWKLPLVYGGFLVCSYAITWNSSMYSTYKTAYKDITDNDPATDSYLDVLPKGFTYTSSYKTTLTSQLKSKRDFYRRYRDMNILIAIGFYAITLVDAYVDAQLYDFDISPDLSLRVQPTMLTQPGSNNKGTFAMQCCFRLK